MLDCIRILVLSWGRVVLLLLWLLLRRLSHDGINIVHIYNSLPTASDLLLRWLVVRSGRLLDRFSDGQ